MSHHFTHLHLHTEFSLLDGALSLDNAIKVAKSQNAQALGISDHGNIFGAVKFFDKCKKANLKPILGMETYFTEDATIKNPQNKYYHLLLIVENEIGYKNLCKLISFAHQDGFYFKPRIDFKTLEKYSKGLIIGSACLGGHIPQLILANEIEQAEKQIDYFLNLVGPDNFYLEVQPEEQPEQAAVNKVILELGKKKNVACIGTCDAHYATPQDKEAHEIMLAIQTHDTIDNPERYSFGQCCAYMRSPEEMLAIFKDNEEVVWNTGKIADRCTFTFPKGKLFFPKFPTPAEHTPISYFEHLCHDGFKRLQATGQIPEEILETYQTRLTTEIELIIKMGFAEYFLVVSDFIQWAKNNGVPVGPGRGSAAGSLVAWSLQITDIDPIRYNLLFERFLNPERISMPDIDIDFCINGRERVINYVRDRYGHENVCQIITFGTMMAKGVIKDVARAMGFPFEDSNAITSLIPEQLKITLTEALELEPRLKELIDNNPRVQKLFDIAFRLEGLTRHASKHAAGIVISPEPIDSVLPIYIPPKTDELVTQYAMTELESLGFLKMDFLGLKNLTLIAMVTKLIEKNHGLAIDVSTLPRDDEKSFVLLCEGRTSGVFQLESSGIKEVLRKLKPEKFEDIIAVNALYRPGPLGSGMVDDFIERRHGRQKITYIFPELQPILEETYGVIAYQEQVMKIASTIAGFSLGEADILRKAMGKKKVEVMAEQRLIFLERASKKGFDATKAGELFDLMAYFAGYGFNKSHSAAYALIAYQTAYLKAHYPAEFMACLISLEASDPDAMTNYLQEAKDMGIALLPPNINTSEIDFNVVDGKIIFGLLGIKNVGPASLENIVQERAKKPFADILDFCTRIDLRTSNKRVIENLVCAGAFDTMPGTRAQKYTELAKIIDMATEKKRSLETGQLDLFSAKPAAAAQSSANDFYAFQPCTPWTDKETLEKEKEVLGFYLSSHPLETYRKQLNWFKLPTIEELHKTIAAASGTQDLMLSTCGLVKSVKEIITKKGDRMAFMQLEDTTGHAEIIIFPKVFQKVSQWLGNHQIFIVKGFADLQSQQNVKIKANEVVPLELLFEHWPSINKVCVQLPSSCTADQAQKIRELAPSGPTPLELLFAENDTVLRLKAKQGITLDQLALQALAEQGLSIEVVLG